MSAYPDGAIRRAAVIGAGVIGAGWVARLVDCGVDVAVADPDSGAAARVQATVEAAEAARRSLGLPAPLRPGTWTLAPGIAAAAAGAELIVEAVPERLDIKHAALAEADGANPTALIASSTSGFRPTALQAGLSAPGRLIVGHPFVPVYLLPLVEVVGGEATDPAAIERAMALYRTLGMAPLHVRREIDAFIADRLLEAVWREALWLVHDDIATTAEIDEAIRLGFGLRWAQMGLFETYRIGGGARGMRHFIAQFAPALAWPWTKLTDVPALDDALVERIAAQSDAQSGALTAGELARLRDDNLVGILEALSATGQGAGAVVAADRAAREAEAVPDARAAPLVTIRRRVPRAWCDYNGHMNESRYGQLFSDAADAAMRAVGADAGYVARGLSYFTVELHTRFLAEAHAGAALRVTSQVLAGAGKRLHLFHRIEETDGGTLHATGEQMLVHVSLQTRRACDPAPDVVARVAALAAAHAGLPRPEGTGRAVGQPR
ncbi:MAG: carnitine 3-dehydrogenase [Pseudomonadota bacterium]